MTAAWPVQRRVPVPRDHPAFEGHFPGAPVLPGVVLLAWVIDTAQPWAAGRKLAVPEVKFLHPVGPGSELLIELRAQGGGLVFDVRMCAPRPTSTSSAPQGGMSSPAEPDLLRAEVVAARGRLALLDATAEPSSATQAPPAAPAVHPAATTTPPVSPITPVAPTTPSARPAPWVRQGERGNALVLKLMAAIAVACGRRVARWLLPPIALYFVLFSPQARRHSRRYLARVLGRRPGFADGYRHVHTFANLVLDRVYFSRGEVGEFELDVRGLEHLDEAIAGGRGAVLLGAHVGSFAALHALGGARAGPRVAMVMYPDNARMIQATLRAIAPHAHLDIIALGRPGSMLAVRDWLAGGGLVGMLADRQLDEPTQRDHTVRLPFLGVAAPFGEGPLRMAQLLRQRVYFMAGVYQGGRRYEVCFEPLADFTEPVADAAARADALRAALQAYVQKLEALCRHAPYNWFNFHDFWQEDAPA